MDSADREATESVADALARARRHARAAAAESLAAVHALLDAGALATTGMPADHSSLAPVAQWMGRLEAWLGSGAQADGALFDTLLDTLDSEILRWEQRSRAEPEARNVLRAFLAVRELLWELAPTARSQTGHTGEPTGEHSSRARPSGADPEDASAPESEPRLRRVSVQG
ncbi:MAG: hypothetical protein QNK05_01575 [Myxococcota bacterium]|nr:hypothetical protein [Myxococcota bacterium]